MPEAIQGQEYAQSGGLFDQPIRELAERVYGRYNTRDVTRVQLDVETLIANIKGAIIVWLGGGCNSLVATAGFSAPSSLPATPITFAASSAAPRNANL